MKYLFTYEVMAYNAGDEEKRDENGRVVPEKCCGILFAEDYPEAMKIIDEWYSFSECESIKLGVTNLEELIEFNQDNVDELMNIIEGGLVVGD